MKKQTIEWIEEAFKEDSENVLSESKKEYMLKNLSKIDVHNLKVELKYGEQSEQWVRTVEKFYNVFEIFDCEED